MVMIDYTMKSPSVDNTEGLDLASVRSLAQQEGYKEAYFNEQSRVVSFAKEGETDECIRINVYYTTGTVGTCLNHPKQGRTQLFRRNVSLRELREIFRNPRLHTGRGYQQKLSTLNSPKEKSRKRRKTDFGANFPVGSRAYVRGYANCTIESGAENGLVKVRYDDGTTYHVNPTQLAEVMEEVLDEESAAKEHLRKLRDDSQAIADEIANTQDILDTFERHREEAARLEAERKCAREAERIEIERKLQASARLERGSRLGFLLFESSHVEKSFNENVTSIACGGKATIMLYEGGGWSFTKGLPKLLHNKLNGRQISLPKPVYVALGSQDRYYIKFADGKSEWVGCEAMTKELHENKREVTTVAFGSSWDCYFIVYKDGYWSYRGGVPESLRSLMERRNLKSDLNCVSLGPDGEYFVSAKNGRSWWGGVSSETLAVIAKVKDKIKFMDFGDDDSYLYRYS